LGRCKWVKAKSSQKILISDIVRVYFSTWHTPSLTPITVKPVQHPHFYTFAEGIMISIRSLQRIWWFQSEVCNYDDFSQKFATHNDFSQKFSTQGRTCFRPHTAYVFRRRFRPHKIHTVRSLQRSEGDLSDP